MLTSLSRPHKLVVPFSDENSLYIVTEIYYIVSLLLSFFLFSFIFVPFSAFLLINMFIIMVVMVVVVVVVVVVLSSICYF